jgi:hypothetical protein
MGGACGHVGEMRCVYKNLSENLEVRYHVEDLDVVERITLE